jgi:leucine dehydrogenase
VAAGIESLIEGWNGHAVVVRLDRPTGTWIFIAIHDPTLGRPTGGTRMQVYESLEAALLDAQRLAEGMTCKWAAIDMPFGGGKSVLAVPRPLQGAERIEFFGRYGRFLESLGGTFATGVDLGTTPEDMALIGRETRYVHGLNREDGSPLDPGPFTAQGVFSGMEAALEPVFGGSDLRGRRVLVEGVGDVGAPLARLVAEAGGELLVADIDDRKARDVAGELSAEVVAPGSVYGTPCDVYAPCAVGATLKPETVPKLSCRIVAGSANNQLESAADADRLHERGILYAPDYIINAGGAMAFGLMAQGIEDEAVLFQRVEGIGSSLREIFREAAEGTESPVLAARRRVDRILARGPKGQ